MREERALEMAEGLSELQHWLRPFETSINQMLLRQPTTGDLAGISGESNSYCQWGKLIF